MEFAKIFTDAAVSTAYGTWALVGATLLLAVGVFVAWRQMKADHERSRRERAVTLGAEFTRFQTNEMITAITFANFLDEHTARTLREAPVLIRRNQLTSLEIPKESLPLAKILVPRLEHDHGKLELNLQEVLHIRGLLIRYLNEIEVVMSARMMGVVDRKTIDEEFGFLVEDKKETPQFLMHSFFSSAREFYPGTYKFLQDIKAMRSRSNEGRGNVA